MFRIARPLLCALMLCFLGTLTACTSQQPLICSLPADILGQMRPTLANGVLYFGGEFGYVYALSAATGKLLWSTPVPDSSSLSQPTIANDVLYTAGHDALYALDATTGKLLWQAPLPYQSYSFLPSTPAVGNGLVYVMGAQGVAAFHLTHGTLAWKYAQPAQTVNGSAPEGDPTLANTTLFFGADGVYALNATTGKLRWHHAATVSQAQYATPIIADGTLYVTSSDGTEAAPASTPTGKSSYLEALRPSDGKLLWHTAFSAWPASRPLVVAGALYLVGQDATHYVNAGVTYAFDQQTGKARWNVPQPDTTFLFASNTDWPPASDQTTLYLGGSALVAITIATHAVHWQMATTERPSLPGALVGTTLYVGIGGSANYTCGGPTIPPTDGQVEAVNSATGATVWHVTLSQGKTK
jgi:outer membrane protein assembly factor BamB